MQRWSLDLGTGLDGAELVVGDDELIAAEHTLVYVLVNEQLAHREADVDALHCPVCRSAYLAVTAGTRAGRAVTAELARLGAMKREDVLALVVLPIGEGGR